ncbi:MULTISPECIES: hypothetical protein [unclassified Acinetobacter]|uniref:hypothetical protein n=1 Tax=unclassified Acinetobacter TaxID=196816 RepID=UPI0018AA396A|nr:MULTISPECIES: hypothetical protein [unclassified Acinetobacter]MBJ9953494.1 hypothetical protein [Acinetobacter baumannii]
MNKHIQFRAIFCVFIASSLSACQSQFVTTPNLPTEANLVANSVNNGLETELNIDYLVAFKNLKMAYGRCVAFTGEHDFVFTDNKLEQDLEMGTLFARTKGGAYLSKTLVESIGKNKTRLTLFLPTGYKSAQARFKLDAKRALGQDPSCNAAKPI